MSPSSRFTNEPSPVVTFGGVRRHTARGMRKISKAALMGGAAAAAIAATVGVAAPASSYTADDAFLDTLSANGVIWTSTDSVIAEGHQVCAAFDMGYGFHPVVDAVRSYSLANWGPYQAMSDRQSAGLVGAAIGAYCPWHEDVIYGSPAPQLKRAL
jgi:Protein of unknown function (DUF732)